MVSTAAEILIYGAGSLGVAQRSDGLSGLKLEVKAHFVYSWPITELNHCLRAACSDLADSFH